LRRVGPAEEISFLRSVRFLSESAISLALRADVKSGPDVFADALVPLPAQPWQAPCSAIPVPSLASSCLIPRMPLPDGLALALARRELVTPINHRPNLAAGRRDGYRFFKPNSKPKMEFRRNCRWYRHFLHVAASLGR
jgi:hypothetical protein